jgi:hypothetical protein
MVEGLLAFASATSWLKLEFRGTSTMAHWARQLLADLGLTFHDHELYNNHTRYHQLQPEVLVLHYI